MAASARIMRLAQRLRKLSQGGPPNVDVSAVFCDPPERVGRMRERGAVSGTDLKDLGERGVKPARPRLYRVILLNDDFTPRDFVVGVLKKVFGLSRDQAHGVMITAHRKGVCVVAVFTREIAETKATQATEMGAREGYPLRFLTEPED